MPLVQVHDLHGHVLLNRSQAHYAHLLYVHTGGRRRHSKDGKGHTLRIPDCVDCRLWSLTPATLALTCIAVVFRFSQCVFLFLLSFPVSLRRNNAYGGVHVGLMKTTSTWRQELSPAFKNEVEAIDALVSETSKAAKRSKEVGHRSISHPPVATQNLTLRVY